MLRDYEITFVLTTGIDEETSAATVERVNQLIAAGGGSVAEVHAWGRRRLAYPIQHQRDGFYVTTRFSLPTEAVSRLDNDLRLNEHILRHLVVRQDEVPLRPIVPAAAQGGAPSVSGAAGEGAEIRSGATESDLETPADEAVGVADEMDADFVPEDEEE